MLLQMDVFLLLLYFLLTYIPLSSSQYINPYVLSKDFDNLTCATVPYPFGIDGEALHGFEISCPKEKPWSSPPLLYISNKAYKINEISLQGYIKIFAGPIKKSCIGANGKLDEPQGSSSGSFNLSGTPFTLSYQYNMLTIVGCNNLVLIRSQETNLTSGCVTFCDPQVNLPSGSCSGMGCCQAALPGTLKSFELEFQQVKVANSSGDSLKCSTAYFTQIDYFQSNKSGFLFQDLSFKDNNNLIQLGWAIGNKSCEDAISDNSWFACKNNSYCYNSPSMSGYLCNCDQGYEGNPYSEHGCTDIDECLKPDSNPCIGNCHNLPGTYICKRGFPIGVALGILIGVVTTFGSSLLILATIVLFCNQKKRKIKILKKKHFIQNRGLLLKQLLCYDEDAKERMKVFSIEDLEMATNKFDKTRLLGRGGHGEVYKGILSDKRIVAIKKSCIASKTEIDQFINEVVILSQINHRNVVKLFGCCLETEVPLLVYEFISNGTLSDHLHADSSTCLSWDDRLRIALETARALAYLHTAAQVSVYHRDIKPANIMLDDTLTAKLSDFGASRSVSIDQTRITTAVQGTYGYLDPEYFYTSRLTDKSDVYSFGVILVELLTRETPHKFSRPEAGPLVSYFVLLQRENCIFELLDPEVVPKIQRRRETYHERGRDETRRTKSIAKEAFPPLDCR